MSAFPLMCSLAKLARNVPVRTLWTYQRTATKRRRSHDLAKKTTVAARKPATKPAAACETSH